MKNLTRLAAVAVAATIAAAVCARADELRNVKLGEPIPEFTMRTLGGDQIQSKDLLGKVVALVFLAAEQKNSERAAIDAHNVGGRLDPERAVLVFATADTAQAPYFKRYREDNEIGEPLCLDFDRKLYGGLGLIVVPTTVIIDAGGKLAGVMSGYTASYSFALSAHVRHALGEIDDVQLKAELSGHGFERDTNEDRAARHRAAAKILREHGLFVDAENELLAGLEVDPKSIDIRLDLAMLYVARDRVPEARARLDEALKLDPEHRRSKLVLGVVLFHENRLDEARTMLEESLLLNPDPTLSHYYLGRVCEARGEKDEALSHYRDALSRLLGLPRD